ncbi:MAG: PEGA domain-containing protein [Kiritimatiellia bacterium]|nr:PEGA domain-containing protein [Kiritimatiellia bacterium]
MKKIYSSSQRSEIRGQSKIILWLAILCFLAVLPACRQGEFMPAKNSQVYVTTDPAGAILFCDSVSCGNTPATIASIAAGEHLLVVRKPGYREARATVAVATRAGERLAVELKLEELQGLVLVQSAPAGADLKLDGAHIGKTPLFSHDFPLGERQIQISMPGYLPKSVNLKVEDRTPIKINVSLVSDSAELLVESSPTGAVVTMDNSVVGTTPLTLAKAKTGEHTLELTLRGHSSAQHEITLQAGEKQKISANLKPLPGKLTVLSKPAGARIYLGNQFKAETPFGATNIPSGQYMIRAELRGYDPQTRTNEVIFGEETTVEFNLDKSSGTLLISTLPPEINVYLDGEFRGTTKMRGNEQISDQLQIDFIPKGRHQLQFTKKGYYDVQRVLDIMPKQTVILHEKLVIRPVPFVPEVIIRTGDQPEQTFRGIIRERYANGDIKVEIEVGIFKTFDKTEIISLEAIPSAGKRKTNP